jgi:hypothetical protein
LWFTARIRSTTTALRIDQAMREGSTTNKAAATMTQSVAICT